jgi:hypothetical protein
MQLSPLYNSTCSLASDKRGPHQRVIAYSLYGNFSLADVSNKYFEPLKNTISLIPRIYPGNFFFESVIELYSKIFQRPGRHRK